MRGKLIYLARFKHFVANGAFLMLCTLCLAGRLGVGDPTARCVRKLFYYFRSSAYFLATLSAVNDLIITTRRCTRCGYLIFSNCAIWRMNILIVIISARGKREYQTYAQEHKNEHQSKSCFLH